MLKSKHLVLSGVVALAACGGEPLAPGEQSMTLGFPRSANCEFVGANITSTLNENMLGKGLSARGDLRNATLVCVGEDGQRVQTTDHARLFARGQSANATLYSVRAGQVRVGVGQYRNGSQYSGIIDFFFTPAG